MADGTDKSAREQEPGDGSVELRITVTGTHTRRDDLEALLTWLQKAPAVEEAKKQDGLTVRRKDSLTQTEAMSGELVQDIVFWVSTEVARNVVVKAWPSVGTWIRNRRRFAADDEHPRVTLDGPETGPGSGLNRDTDRDPGPDAGPEPGRPDRTGGDEPGEG